MQHSFCHITLHIPRFWVLRKIRLFFLKEGALFCPPHICCLIEFSCCSVAKSIQHFVNPWTVAHQASLSFTISQSLLKLMSMMPSNHLILCCPFLLLPSIFPSIRIFSNELALCIGWPKYRSLFQHQSLQ